uniref:Ovule protein n=1 Tax=Haemonchus contortus TaxID=6289 RepID=A0A7I4YW01_HAECO
EAPSERFIVYCCVLGYLCDFEVMIRNFEVINTYMMEQSSYDHPLVYFLLVQSIYWKVKRKCATITLFRSRSCADHAASPQCIAKYLQIRGSLCYLIIC